MKKWSTSQPKGNADQNIKIPTHFIKNGYHKKSAGEDLV
jgi:hypothetical protein